MWYGATIFDPSLILAQMMCMQSVLYLAMGALVFTLRIFAWPYIIRVKHKHNDAGEHTGPPAACARALPMVLDPACTNATSAEGWLIIGAWVVTAVILAFALVPIIERAKKCLDFVATAYGIHFVVASIYAHKLPNTVAFYCTQIFCIVLSAVLGEWLCLSRELQEIPIAAPPSELLPLTSEPAGEAPAYGGRRSPFGGAAAKR
ncbi:protein SYS1 [Pycnococcus provasolii]